MRVSRVVGSGGVSFGGGGVIGDGKRYHGVGMCTVAVRQFDGTHSTRHLSVKVYIPP